MLQLLPLLYVFITKQEAAAVFFFIFYASTWSDVTQTPIK